MRSRLERLASSTSLKDQAAALAARRPKVKEVEAPRQLFLPGFGIGAMPNHLNRSSLIAPIARDHREFHRRAVLVSRSDCVVEYTGEQLDEADGEIIMALIFFAQPFALGMPVPLCRATLLKKIERDTGNQQYKWLHRRLKALTEATLFLEAKRPDGSTRYSIGRTEAFHIVSRFAYDDARGIYTYTLDPRWMQMFGNREYALLDWGKHMRIGRGQNLAKALHRLVATSSDRVQRYALDRLKPKMVSKGRMRDLQKSLERAVKELVRVEILANGHIAQSTKGTEQLVLYLATSV